MVQVDGTTVAEGEPAGEGTPTEPVVTTLAAAAERFPDLVGQRLGSIAAPDDPFVARNDAAWRGGAFVYVPKGQRLEQAAQIAAVHDSDGAAIGFRTLIVLEEGAEAEVWEQWLATDGERAGLFNTVTELIVGPGATLRYVSAQGLGRAQLGVRDPARRGRARRHPRLGRAGLRLVARQGAHGDEAGGAGLDRPRDRRLRRRRRPAPRLRHHPGARGTRTPSPTSPSAASWATPRPRSGAG